jgi:hypothetical protein
MEITWLGIIILLVAWICNILSTYFSFHVYTKKKDYDISQNDKGYLVAAGSSSAVALTFTTIAVLMIILMGRDQFKAHAKIINSLSVDKLELQNKLDEMKESVQKQASLPKNKILENPIPIRRGRSARPLIV